MKYVIRNCISKKVNKILYPLENEEDIAKYIRSVLSKNRFGSNIKKHKVSRLNLIANIENVVAIKMVPFNRSQTFDVVREVAKSNRFEEINTIGAKEVLSPWHSAEIDRIYSIYPELNDDEFVAKNLDRWLT